MPVRGFLSSIADKAQNAMNVSPLGPHMPTSMQKRPSRPDAAMQPTANQGAAQAGSKSHALESIQCQFCSLQQQYSLSTSPVQKIISIESQSKELYTCGRPLKALRDAEAALQPRRNVCAGLHTQIAHIEHEQQKGNDKRLVELRDQLAKAESEKQQLEREVELLKRKGITESEQMK